MATTAASLVARHCALSSGHWSTQKSIYSCSPCWTDSYRYDSSRRRGRHCRLRAFPAGPQSGSISGHAPARAAKLYDRNHRILPGTYEVTDDLPEELMGRDGGQCIVRISCERGGVGSSISGAPHGSERGESRYPVRTAPHNEAVRPHIKAQSQLVCMPVWPQPSMSTAG